MRPAGRFWNSRASLVAAGASMATVLAIDLSTPLGIASAGLYTLPVVATYAARRDRHTWIVASLATVLALGGILQSPGGVAGYKVLTNRAMAVAMIWATGWLIVRIRALERQRRSAQEKANRIVESSMDAIVAIEGSGRVTEWNPQAEDIFGWSREEALGRDLAELIIPTESRQAHRSGLDRFLRTGESEILGRRLELEAQRKGGCRLPVELTITHAKNAGEWQLSGFIRDITARRESERALKRYAEGLRQSNEDLDRFAYAASHDLKAPLRAIDNLATWIAEDAAEALPEGSREDLALLRERVDRMQRLLDDLLDYSRVGRREFASEMIDLRELVEEEVLLLAPPDGCQVELDALNPIPGHRIPLQQVIRNLIGNAIKHRERDEVRVRVTSRLESDRVEIRVEDDGPGIDPEYHDRIFELFQTLQPRDRVEGSGMGLAIVRRIVEGQGGRIRVESTPGEGTTFHVGWPINGDAVDPAELTEPMEVKNAD